MSEVVKPLRAGLVRAGIPRVRLALVGWPTGSGGASPVPPEETGNFLALVNGDRIVTTEGQRIIINE